MGCCIEFYLVVEKLNWSRFFGCSVSGPYSERSTWSLHNVSVRPRLCSIFTLSDSDLNKAALFGGFFSLFLDTSELFLLCPSQERKFKDCGLKQTLHTESLH